MPVTFFYPSPDYANSITLYADSLSVGCTGNNRVIPIRDLEPTRTRTPIFIELGYTGHTIKIAGTIDEYDTFLKYLSLFPDTLLKTVTTSGNYVEFNKNMFWEIKEVDSKAVPGDSFLRTYTLSVTEQHHTDVRG